ncbi:glutamine synthetase III family protein [Clostridium felsineum]|uniref:Glutamine synthetase n=1 Tax=Clostridium felsineum TaxID=36839 RepID=A0A1S8KZ70_9CLOT|nr:glutamine synthetase III [Clostridium felsineum]MCR3759467.1 glutamine synthetase III [Clostridium felsineum]URZ04150.1 Glutamine synthetase [Clostridium felsineum]URZ07660.1 Glutamine synthetase [Clostridium felsineum]URZ12691.1 Glutamine synthetase [Clostridium felsineum]
MERIDKMFGENVFNDAVMKERLTKPTYKALKNTIDKGEPLDVSIADEIAKVMKEWAIEKGATHFTHWFQPLTGLTAEKHDAFIDPEGPGKVILKFSGKELIKGEPDASSFPSGGLRATCSARGYTIWDCTSPAFVKDNTLCIPTVFCSYTGEVLDTKGPLLRSVDALSKEAIRVLRCLGNTTSQKVFPNVGPEQEYFIVDKKSYDEREDLIFTGRTLFGAPSPKGQELDDHYFGVLKERVSAFMKDVDKELWALGITAKTKHNEVAPAQHEIATIYTSGNLATDNNQLVMEVLKKIALRHGLVCLLHEKPFAGINGSGKHNNWSMGTDDGLNLLDPTDTPHSNKQFLLFFTATIKAVDKYADLLRFSASNAGNDHRLGANEAPPAIISVFVGDQLEDILEQLEKGSATSTKGNSKLDLAISTIPTVEKDATDRNRTSPFAFTGNKFEFRMPPSSKSVAEPNTVLNAIVADVLSEIADRLEKASNVDAEVEKILTEIVKEHKKVVFNGNGYADAWVEEAEKRGLPNIKTTVEATKALIADKNVSVFEKFGILTKEELESRYEVALENYAKAINIEALTMIDMASKKIVPAVIKYTAELANSLNAIKAAVPSADVTTESELITKISGLTAKLNISLRELKASTEKAAATTDAYDQAYAYKFDVFEKMSVLREAADALEVLVDKKAWPFPTYSDLLFNV